MTRPFFISPAEPKEDATSRRVRHVTRSVGAIVTTSERSANSPNDIGRWFYVGLGTFRRIGSFYAKLGKVALIFGGGFFGGCFYTGLGIGAGFIR